MDDNWGWRRQQVEIQNLSLLKPHIIRSLRDLLADHPNWSISVAVDIPGTEESWPGMGLMIYGDEIVDELRREFLPEEFRNVTYQDI